MMGNDDRQVLDTPRRLDLRAWLPLLEEVTGPVTVSFPKGLTS